MNTQKKLTRKQAINMNCKTCIYDPTEAGTWRQQVKACPVKTCALYSWRPLPVKASVTAAQQVIFTA